MSKKIFLVLEIPDGEEFQLPLIPPIYNILEVRLARPEDFSLVPPIGVGDKLYNRATITLQDFLKAISQGILIFRLVFQGKLVGIRVHNEYIRIVEGPYKEKINGKPFKNYYTLLQVTLNDFIWIADHTPDLPSIEAKIQIARVLIRKGNPEWTKFSVCQINPATLSSIFGWDFNLENAAGVGVQIVGIQPESLEGGEPTYEDWSEAIHLGVEIPVEKIW